MREMAVQIDLPVIKGHKGPWGFRWTWIDRSCVIPVLGEAKTVGNLIGSPKAYRTSSNLHEPQVCKVLMH